MEACLSLLSFPSLERKGPLIKSPPQSGRGASQIASFTYCNNNSCLWALLFAKSFQTVPWILRETSWRFSVCAHSAGEKLRQEQWIHEARAPWSQQCSRPCPNWLGPKVWDTPPCNSCLSSEPAPEENRMEDFSHPSQRTQRKEEAVGARRMFLVVVAHSLLHGARICTLIWGPIPASLTFHEQLTGIIIYPITGAQSIWALSTQSRKCLSCTADQILGSSG